MNCNTHFSLQYSSHALNICIFPFTICEPYNYVGSTHYEKNDAYMWFMKYLLIPLYKVHVCVYTKEEILSLSLKKEKIA